MKPTQARAGESVLDAAIRVSGAASVRAQLAAMPAGDGTITALDALDYLWDLIARPEQLPPAGAWETWVIQAGRGWGKTRSGAEAIVALAQEAAADVAARRLAASEARIHIVGATAADVRDVMVRGPSGLLACSPPWFAASYQPSLRRVVWPGGVEALLFSAEEPDRLRGPQGIAAWGDELAAWQYPGETWDMLQFGVRLGARPRIVVTTTPRPIATLKQILALPGTRITRGRTVDNVRNLSAAAVAKLTAQYGGTRLGRQELDGEILDDNPRALWRLADIDAARVTSIPDDVRRLVIGVDPAVSSDAASDETGIVAAAVGPCRCRGPVEDHAWVIEDASGTYSPEKWATLVIDLYTRRRADRVVAEINQGGQLVEANLRASEGGGQLSYRPVHASKGKAIRAEPVSSLYEQRKVHHVGTLARLEDQMCQWDPTVARSPDRLDALVYALTDLMIAPSAPRLGQPLQVSSWRTR